MLNIKNIYIKYLKSKYLKRENNIGSEGTKGIMQGIIHMKKI